MELEKKNHIKEPFLLLLLATVVFVVLSLFNSSFSFSNYTFKGIDFLKDVRVAGTMDSSSFGEMNKRGMIQSQRGKSVLNELHPILFAEDSSGGLIHFFEALDLLKSGKKKKVRIAFFGDSMIENDFITQALRKKFQESFGGNGVGFVPVTSISAEFRKTILQTFSGNWKKCELDEVQTHPTGISGYTFVPAWKDAEERKNNASLIGASWVKFEATDLPRLNAFENVSMYFGPASGKQAVVVNQKQISLSGKNLVNVLKLNNNVPLKSFFISFQCENPLDVYGFNFDSDHGIFIDNFSLRGMNGMTLASIPDEMLRGMNQYLDYDLVVFQFGINVLDTKMGNFIWYENGMQGVVAHFKGALPKTSVLIISASDRGVNTNGKWTTNPEIPQVVEAQKSYAEMSGSGYWDLYAAMGGFESMANKWVGGDTVLANKDYTHFNLKGSDRVGEMLYRDLISEYNLYKQQAQQPGR